MKKDSKEEDSSDKFIPHYQYTPAPDDKAGQKKLRVLQALALNAGNVSEACKAAGVGRQTFYDWKDKDDDFTQAVNDVMESLLDFSEAKLMKLINEGHPASIFFYLKCKGKERGYVERREHTGKGGGPIGLTLADFIKRCHKQQKTT